jgi:hypothetical protein
MNRKGLIDRAYVKDPRDDTDILVEHLAPFEGKRVRITIEAI